jgi:hypothetical protein
MMRGSKIIRVVLAVFPLIAPPLLLAQDAGAKPDSVADRPTPPIGHARRLNCGEPRVSTIPREQIFAQLEAAPDEPPLDMVRFRLLRNEIRRWMREASIPDDDSFDDWAFGGEQGEKRFRDQVDNLLQSKLQVVSRVFQLTEPQRRKVKLAGRGDIKHLLEMVDDSRREFKRASVDVRRLPDLQEQLRLVELRVSNGPFEAGSMLAKTLRKLFDEKELIARPVNTVQ